MHLATPLAVATLATFAAAQPQFTSPPGIGADGDSVVSSLQPFNTGTGGRRFQYVVNDILDLPPGAGTSIQSLTLRPDPASVSSPGRGANVTLVLDHAQYPALSTTFANNYSGSEVTHALGTVSLPATVGSSGFAIAFPLPAPFLYFGRRNTPPTHTALLFEFRTTAVVGGTTYSLDCADGTTAPQAGRSSYLGLQPCVVPPNAAGFDIIRHDPTTAAGLTTIAQNALRGPIASFGALALGTTDPNTTLGGLLCAPLRASPDITIPIATDGQGAIATFTNPVRVSFPDLLPAQSLRLYSQFAVADAGRSPPQIGVALSDAIAFDLTAPRTVERRLLWSTSSATAALGTLTEQFVPVVRFN